MNNCRNNHEKSSTTKINEYEVSGYSMLTHCSFDAAKNKLDCYRGKDCMKRFCKDFEEHATEIFNYEKEKEMMPLSSEERKLHCNQKVCYISKNKFSTDDNKKVS